MTSYHEYNKVDKARYLVGEIQKGKNVAIITDAGTPGISDPGEEICRQCVEAGIEVSSLSGPAACITALTMSGLPTRRFSFEAFLPRDKKERQMILEELKTETRTIVMYEAPHHLKDTLKELLKHLGNRKISLCREITKKYEENIYTTIEDAIKMYEVNDPRGEYVLVIEGRDREKDEIEKQKNWMNMELTEHMNLYLKQGMDKKSAMKQVAKDRGVSKRDVYNELLKEETDENGEN
jgi:16S rRNA (cytidine1402-2'-O)-methyltransferase